MRKRRFVGRTIAAARNVLEGSRIKGAIYTWAANILPVNRKVVLFESHKGVDFIGSPYHMAKSVLSRPEYSAFRFVIVCPRAARGKVRALNKAGHKVTFCRQNSFRYCIALATAGTLVNDVTFPPYFFRRDGQRYLNTWHGTPLKSLGIKTSTETFAGLGNIQRNFLQATHILAPNSHTRDAILHDHMISKLWSGNVIHGGYPRNDPLTAPEAPLLSAKDAFLHLAFMPTWRGTPSSIEESSEKFARELSSLFSHLDDQAGENVVFWVRLHPLMRKAVDLRPYSRIRPFPDDMDSYAFLARCDALITDYSSVLFDFAATGRPVIMHVPDLAEYRSERDFCLDIGSLPFARTSDTAGLLEAISELMPGIRQSGAGEFLHTFCPHDNGHASDDLSAQMLLGEERLETEHVTRDSSRKSVIIFAGSFLNNGITSSLKSLLAQVDPDRYNFFLCIDARIAEARGTKFLLQMDNRIGVIATRNWLSITPFEAIGFLARDLFSSAWSRDDKPFRRIWKREYRRLLGNVQFDCMVHFTGYERRLSFLMTASSARKIVFCHNDMLKEVASHRVSDPRALKLAYEQADIVASVREGTIDGYSREVLDISGKNILVPNTIPLTCVQRSTADIESALHPDTPTHVRDRILRAFGEDGKFRFINLARFSREKGQDRLITAFEEIWSTCPDAQLFVLGPHGILFEEIVARASISPAREGIFVAQGSDNPFPILARCHASILASFYEGLPMVIFESLALGVPVISTDIPGPSEFLGQGYGMVVPNDIQGLIAGMRAAIDGHVQARPYDFDEHNAWAVSRFYAAIEAAGAGALHQ